MGRSITDYFTNSLPSRGCKLREGAQVPGDRIIVHSLGRTLAYWSEHLAKVGWVRFPGVREFKGLEGFDVT